MKDQKMERLPAMYELKEFTNTMYKHELWRAFIINYLLIT